MKSRAIISPKMIMRPVNIIIVLLVVCIVIIVIQSHENSSLKKANKTLNTQISSVLANDSRAQQKIDDLNSQLSGSKSLYSSLEQAALHDPAHADEIGHRLGSCNPSSKFYLKPVAPTLTPDQQQVRCAQVVYDVFIDDYVSQYAN